METYVVVLIVLLILALLFFGFTLMGNRDSGTSYAAGGGYPSSYGGGCGR